MKFETILKCHEWHLRQISRKNHAIIFVSTTTHERFVIFTCRYFKLSWNTTALSQSICGNCSCSSINNGNWTEWSAIWSEIIPVISKSDEHATWVRFEMTSTILDHNLLHSTQFNYHFITVILKHKIQSVKIFYWSSSQFLEKRKQKGFSFHFVSESEMMQYSNRAKMVQFKTEMMQFRT